MNDSPAADNTIPESHGFLCARCGQRHAELPFAYGPSAPALYYQVPEDARDDRCELTSDICVVDQEHFFIVGNLEVPVAGTERAFSWDVWVSLSREKFQRAFELWESDDRVDEPPYFGWLSTSLPGFPETLNLKTHVHTRAVGRRPFIELEPTDHPLAVEQQNGITMDRVKEIAALTLHPDG